MKFVTDSVARCAARMGTLTGFDRIPSMVLETPLVLVYTKRGCVPHLTKDIFQSVISEQCALSLSLPTTLSMVDPISELKVNYANFVGMKEYIHFLSIQDPGEAIDFSYEQSSYVAVQCRTGKRKITVNDYMNAVQTFKPDLYLALCKGDTNINSSKKRVMKNVHSSNLLLEQCLKTHQDSKLLKLSSGILGAVEGGYNLEARQLSINYLKDKPLQGYVIDGLHENGAVARDIPFAQIREIVQHTIELLPAEKLRVSMGSWNPVTVLGLINLGVDIFDTTYAYIATEKTEALNFLCNDCCNNVEPVIKISEERYKNDFSPICKKCQCLACQNHTKAYMHHLSETKEMLGMVLLMIHNMHHYYQFFSAIRENLRNGTFDEFQVKICSKFRHSESQSVSR
ncbi:hypothetical protein KM043_016708 [Ampulex compressa]|nr:hypothetical protein KM043_016708 [Ampulex compressa]